MKTLNGLIPCIISGGSGTRLWPVSRQNMPKPFMRMRDGQSLLQKTFLRAATVNEAPTHWATVKGDAQACLQSAGRWRMPVDMVVSLDPSLKGRETHVGAWLAQETAHWWRQQSGHSTRWHWDLTEVRSPSNDAPASPYMRAVLGTQSQRSSPWRLQLVLGTDHLRIIALCEAAAYFAFDVLEEGGTFVAKVLAGGADNDLVAELKRNFTAVKHAKPPASRKDSSEWYVIAQGFKG